MDMRYLFGPIAETWANDCLKSPLESGQCLVLDSKDGSALGLKQDWQKVTDRFPGEWKPDFLVLSLAHGIVEPVLWQAPIPIIGLAANWRLNWHYFRHCLQRCDLVISDAEGCSSCGKKN